MNILILDDLPERHEGFIKIFNSEHNLTHAWTYSDAVKAMKNIKFDMACLDHDLGDLTFDGDSVVNVKSLNFELEYTPDFVNDGMYNTSKRFLDGRDVCRWMIDNEFKCPKKVLIHSWNQVAAEEMKKILSSISWLDITVRPFKIS